MKKLVKEKLNEESNYYPHVEKIADKLTAEIASQVPSFNLKEDEEYNLYVFIEQWATRSKYRLDNGWAGR